MFTAIGQSDNDGHFLELCLTTQILWICEALVFPHIHGVLSPHSLESLHSSCFFRTRLDHIGINSMIAGCYTPVMIHCRCYRMLAFVWTCSWAAEGRREEGCFEIEWQDFIVENGVNENQRSISQVLICRLRWKSCFTFWKYDIHSARQVWLGFLFVSYLLTLLRFRLYSRLLMLFELGHWKPLPGTS
jgi:hypothetical protein